jgi:hypothetical protein
MMETRNSLIPVYRQCELIVEVFDLVDIIKWYSRILRGFINPWDIEHQRKCTLIEL